ncbi:MAG TPA: tryptophan--tRNA ligase [Clostridia bacterium]|nr:tryptophan--tRNA ligase [Clostridia bacterium]
MERKKRILTGDRPTGRLHIGHYVGSLVNRVKLQHEYETFIIIADVQALTTHFENPEILKSTVYEVALDNLASGIDPEISTIFIQSMIPQIAELTIFYSMFVTVNVLRHNPTIKTEAEQYGYKDLTYGFLGYPVSQAADITFCKADLVPVGEDQAPHLEAARKIVRRFNSLYKPVLVEPEILLGNCPRLVGLDGNSKMSKSLNNAIYLSDSAEEVNSKVKSTVTDPGRIKLNDKGNPDICVVHAYHSLFSETDCGNLSEMCRNAGIGCTACKKQLAASINRFLTPIRERRMQFAEKHDYVKDILMTGTSKAGEIARQTLDEVREAMSIRYFA